ncbi:hypothetical protein ABZ912_42570 [Nonomuraea angiospora]|uniref:hypothetical protein n=1 Tax=Nonomuraea angiospora TaxID=46172 RepID=UPI0033F0C3DC
MTASTVAPAIALDELLRRPDLPHQLNQAREALRAAGYGWLIDQGDAAVTDTHARLRDLVDRNGGAFVPTPVDQHPDWVRLPIFATLADWLAGRARTCIHNPTPRRPQPVHAAAWKPGLVTCNDCIALFLLRRDSPKNRTCDGCGYVIDPGRGEKIWPTVISCGVLSYQVAACADCLYWDTP